MLHVLLQATCFHFHKPLFPLPTPVLDLRNNSLYQLSPSHYLLMQMGRLCSHNIRLIVLPSLPIHLYSFRYLHYFLLIFFNSFSISKNSTHVTPTLYFLTPFSVYNIFIANSACSIVGNTISKSNAPSFITT